MIAKRFIVGVITSLCGAAVAAQAPPPAAMTIPPPPTATGVLTAPPGQPSGEPVGTYAGPWSGRGGSVSNGPLTYELYATSGVSLPVGNSTLSAALKTGSMSGGGIRTLWFNDEADAAWVFDTNVTYNYNRGKETRTIAVGTPRTQQTFDQLGQVTGSTRLPQDGIADYRLRGLNRTNFNFAVGREWYTRGPGAVGREQESNWRYGADFGGRWGTAHVDLEPRADQANYLRKSGVIHGFFVGTHLDWEQPMGAWIIFAGVRAEYGYTFTNVIPPQDADIHDVNILFRVGVRF